ncbi:aspartate aminotransferase [Camillea tinctor]|nr:aspartate aminotransferase [Camillea tinctor]
MFRNLPPSPSDPMLVLKRAADNDHSPDKVDLGVGVYRNEQGAYHELQALKEAKKILSQENPGHDYEVTTGKQSFLQNAAELVFSAESEVIQSRRLTSVQTISGTGAVHLAALFLSRCAEFKDKKVYIGTPAWGNYEPIFTLVGFQVAKYRHYSSKKAAVDFDEILKAVGSAPPGSIFVLQACCHNPTGADFSKEQWRALAEAMKERRLFPFFDIAYQGLGGGLEEDAYSVQHFTQMGFELLACQSFSKNFGIYGERCGVLHVVGEDSAVAGGIYEQLRCLIRWEFSSSPAYGSRLVNIILQDPSLTLKWRDELASMRDRLVENRKKLYYGITEEKKTPGDWTSIISTTGLFCYLPLTPEQCSRLRVDRHIYFPENGRINVAGLNASNLKTVISAIYEVVTIVD